MVPKPALVAGLLLVVAAIALFAPWYPVTTSQVVPQTQSYTTQFEMPTTNYQTVTVYTLPSPVEVQSSNYGPPSPPCYTSWIYCKAGMDFHSENFTLYAGTSYSVTVNECQQCAFDIEELFAPYDTYASIAGSGQTSFIAPVSGTYDIDVFDGINGTTTPGMLNAISITASIPQSGELTQTVTTYTTTSVTEHSQITVPFYIVLGVVPSAAIIGILVIAALFFALRRRETTHRPKQATLSQFVKAPSSCIKCGAELPSASEFCNKCGTKQS